MTPEDFHALVSDSINSIAHKAVALVADVSLDIPHNVTRGHEWLATQPEPTEGTASDTLYTQAAWLFDYGLSFETVLAQLVDHSPGYTEDDIATRVYNASKHKQNDTGAHAGSGIMVEGVKAWFAAHPQISANAEKAAEVERHKWEIEWPEERAKRPPLTYWDAARGARGVGMMPRMPESCSLIVCGQRSSHKTGVVMKECIDAMLLGARVLYLACEGAHGIDTARLPALAASRGLTLAALRDRWATFSTSPGLLSEEQIDNCVEAMQAQGFAPDIIVIDTMTRAIGGEDISTTVVGQGIIVGMERLGKPFNALVIAITHPGKDASRGSIGSSLIESLAFAIWYVTLSDGVVRVKVDKMKDGPAEFENAFKVSKNAAGVPLIVDPAEGEIIAPPVSHDDGLVSETAVRLILGTRRGKYVFEDELAEMLAGARGGPEDADEWNNRMLKSRAGLASARSRKWGLLLSCQRARTGGSKLEAAWYMPE
jgi:hypothetical protein